MHPTTTTPSPLLTCCVTWPNGRRARSSPPKPSIPSKPRFSPRHSPAAPSPSADTPTSMSTASHDADLHTTNAPDRRGTSPIPTPPTSPHACTAREIRVPLPPTSPSLSAPLIQTHRLAREPPASPLVAHPLMITSVSHLPRSEKRVKLTTPPSNTVLNLFPETRKKIATKSRIERP